VLLLPQTPKHAHKMWQDGKVALDLVLAAQRVASNSDASELSDVLGHLFRWNRAPDRCQFELLAEQQSAVQGVD